MSGSREADTPGRIDLAAVSAISCAQIVLELLLSRLFSVTLYYHFAFMVVSLALFGLAVAGVVVSSSGWGGSTSRSRATMAASCALFGLSTLAALAVVLHVRIPAGGGWRIFFHLLAIYFPASVPFFFSGTCLALAMTRWSKHAGRVYFWDLAGAAAGCVLTVPLLDLAGGIDAVLVVAAIGGATGLLWASGRGTRLLAALACVASLLLLVANPRVGVLRIPSAKAVDESRVVFAKWNSLSRITVSPGEHDFLWMNIDSDAATRIFSAGAWKEGRRDNLRFSETRLASLVYETGPKEKAVVIGPGGGADVLAALQKGAGHVLGIELNDIIVEDVMLGRFAEYSGRLYESPSVQVIVGEGRSSLRRSQERFDVIQATLVDTWAATSAGAFTLSENMLYTVEAFVDFIEHLGPRGRLSMTRWLRRPPREFVRLAAIGVEALRRLDAAEPPRHFFVAADSRMANLILKRTPFEKSELLALEAACRRDGLRVLYNPERPGHDLLGRLIASGEPEMVWNNYHRDISPPTDDRPFFFYTTPPSKFLSSLFGAGGQADQPVELLAKLLLVVLVATMVVLFLPLAFGRVRAAGATTGGKLLAMCYFAGLGLGFIALEMAWIQHFVLFLGHPVYALSVVLFGLLLATSAGSRLSQRLDASRAPGLALATGMAIALLGTVYSLGLGEMFHRLVHLPFAGRVAIAVAVLAPAGVLMGTMLPLGVRWLHQRKLQPLVAWAWGVNGAASVLGTVIAVALSINLGFKVTQLSASVVYVLAACCLHLAGSVTGRRAEA